jgi:hypothetical protein
MVHDARRTIWMESYAAGWRQDGAQMESATRYATHRTQSLESGGSQ